MGTEAIWVPLVIAAVGTGVQVYNTQQTERRQTNEVNRQLREQADIDKKGQAAVQAQLLKQQQSSPDAFAKSSLDQYMTQIQQSQSKANAGLGAVGAVNERFNEGAADAAGDIFSDSAARATSLSKIDAPRLQRMAEGISFNRTNQDIGRVGALSDSARYLGDIRMRGIKRDPWLDAVGSLAQGYGSSGGGL